MAARLNKLHQEDVRRYYVYELFSGDCIKYVGKGSKNRLAVQMKAFGFDGRIVKWFDSEKKAYEYERKHIALVSPELNRCVGGNGSRAKRRTVVRLDAFAKLCKELGTRVVAARMALNFPSLCDPSKLDEIRRIAYG